MIICQAYVLFNFMPYTIKLRSTMISSDLFVTVIERSQEEELRGNLSISLMNRDTCLTCLMLIVLCITIEQNV